MRRLLLAILCWLSSFPLFAVEFDAAKLGKIRERMQGFVDQKLIAGAVTCVGSKDGVAHLEAVGLQKIETKQPMPKDALFRIASMTKPITAIGIMIQQEDGKLSVDDPVEKHLPEFRGQRVVASREGDSVTLKKPLRLITIRDLLTHTSGLPGGFPPGLADLYATRHARWPKRCWSARSNRSTSSRAASGRTATLVSTRLAASSRLPPGNRSRSSCPFASSVRWE